MSVELFNSKYHIPSPKFGKSKTRFFLSEDGYSWVDVGKWEGLGEKGEEIKVLNKTDPKAARKLLSQTYIDVANKTSYGKLYHSPGFNTISTFIHNSGKISEGEICLDARFKLCLDHKNLISSRKGKKVVYLIHNEIPSTGFDKIETCTYELISKSDSDLKMRIEAEAETFLVFGGYTVRNFDVEVCSCKELNNYDVIIRALF
jgi:hypothetical protein